MWRFHTIPPDTIARGGQAECFDQNSVRAILRNEATVRNKIADTRAEPTGYDFAKNADVIKRAVGDDIASSFRGAANCVVRGRCPQSGRNGLTYRITQFVTRIRDVVGVGH